MTWERSTLVLAGPHFDGLSANGWVWHTIYGWVWLNMSSWVTHELGS
jgi:hypothetical protein